MRRFEFVEGKSSKFWEVDVAGSDMTVRYGRIGAAGTTQTKTFASDAKAQAEADKLIREKTGKGYVETQASDEALTPKPKEPAAPKAAVAAGASGNDSASSSAEAKPKVAEAPNPPSPPAQAKEVEPASVSSAELAAPAGQFRWSPAMRASVVAYRGEGAKAAALDREELLGKIVLHGATDEEEKAYAAQMAGQLGQALASQVGQILSGVAGAASSGPSFAVGKEVKSEVTRKRLEQYDEGFWHTLFATAAEWRDYGPGARSIYGTRRMQLDWAVKTCTCLHGLPKAVYHYYEMLAQGRAPMLNGYRLGYGGDTGLTDLGNLIASADEDVYQECLGIARSYAHNETLVVVTAHLFDTEPDLFEPAVEVIKGQSGYDGPPGSLLLNLRLDVAQAKRLISLDRVWIYMAAEHMLAAMANWIARHGAAALPLVLALLDKQRTADVRKPMIEVVRAFDSPEAFAALIDRVDQKDVRPVVDQLAKEWPQLMLKLAAERAQSSRSKAIEAWLTRFAAAEKELVPSTLAMLGEAPAKLLQQLAAKLDVESEEAAPDELPEVLRSPPWTQKTKKAEAEVALSPIAAPATPDAMVWPDGLKAEWIRRFPAKPKEQFGWLMRDGWGNVEASILAQCGVKQPYLRERILAGQRIDVADFDRERWRSNQSAYLTALSPAAAIALWESAPSNEWDDYNKEFDGLVATHELAFLPGLLRYIGSSPERGLELALPYWSANIVPLAADALRRTKKAKFPAQRWLMAHAEQAAGVLIAAATSPDKARAEDAGFALRWLATNQRGEVLAEVAKRLGPDGPLALDHVLNYDALGLYPRRIPKLPAFFVPGGFARPRLKTGAALPLSAVEHLGTMLTFCALDNIYAGIDIVKEHCTAESLSEFAWDLFLAWLQSGAPNKEQWAFVSLGLLGNDESARRLAPLIRQWPGEGGHARAVLGLQVLSAIGTDVALMHLNGIAQKVKFKGLQERARERIAAIAETRGLTTEELADRLVPDLGLDEQGTLNLDFGPRHFSVGFDEQLRPFVRDASGARLKDLPKPGKSDDATLSGEAVARYKALKKDVRTLASQQIKRLELAMSARRRWSAEEFRLFLVEHPLLRHLVQRLLWGCYGEQGIQSCFRVAEDLTYANADDDLYELPADARVGLVHPLELDAASAGAFGQIFADYEILQPFRQLGRETYALSEAELKSPSIERFKDRKVATGSVFGLENKGWRRGEPQDGGWIGWFTKPLGEGLEIHLDLDPGTVVGDISYEPEQKLRSVTLQRAGSWGEEAGRPLSMLHPILISEIMRDLDQLN